MKTATVISVLGILLVSLSCKGTPLPENKKEYAGTWIGDGINLIISRDGGLSYKKVRSGGQSSVNAPIQEFTDQEIRAGLWIFSAKFKIDRPPTLEEGKWRMEIDGEKLTKVE